MNNKKRFRIILVLLLLGITLGYAVLGANLTINGNSKLSSSTWDIHFNNVVPKSGSVAIGTGDQGAVITQGDTTEVTYAVTLSKPGDFYEFEVDAVNAGTVDGMIDTITSTYKIGEGEVTPITASSLPAYLDYSATYSNGVTIAQNQLLEAGDSETYKVRIEFKRDIENNQLPSTEQTLTFNFAVNYVQADSNAVPVVPPAFNELTSWDDLIEAIDNGEVTPTVGDTKTVDMGTLGTHTLRVVNTSTPSECSSAGFSETACGLVLEFADAVTNRPMHSSDSNVGGWPATSLRSYVNSNIYNALPSALKDAIIDTSVVSGHGSDDSSNFTSTDKLYLLSTKEVFGKDGESNVITIDTAEAETRQLDYYRNLGVTTANHSQTIKNGYWWLRSTYGDGNRSYFFIDSDGDWSGYMAIANLGVSPAFRIG